MDLCHILFALTAFVLVESQSPQRAVGTRPSPSAGSRRNQGKVGNINPYKAMIVQLHNDYRRSEGGSNIKHLRWSPRLAKDAHAHVKKCRYVHEYGNWGENLYKVESHLPDDVLIERALSTWYYEKISWNWQPDCSEACHFTQMVWAQTTELGCAFKRCPILHLREEYLVNAWFFTCFYNPRGNEIGSFPYNIGQPCTDCDRNDVCKRDLCISTRPVYYKPAKKQQTSPRKPKDSGGHVTTPERVVLSQVHKSRPGNQKVKVDTAATRQYETRAPIASKTRTEKKPIAHYQQSPKSEVRVFQPSNQAIPGHIAQHGTHLQASKQVGLLKTSIPMIDRKQPEQSVTVQQRSPVAAKQKAAVVAGTAVAPRQVYQQLAKDTRSFEKAKNGVAVRTPVRFSYKTYQAARQNTVSKPIGQQALVTHGQQKNRHPNDIQTHTSLLQQPQQQPQTYQTQHAAESAPKVLYQRSQLVKYAPKKLYQTQQVVEPAPKTIYQASQVAEPAPKIISATIPPPLPPSVAPIPKCPDEDPNCHHWKVYCTTNPYVHDHCRNTCDTCHIPTPPQVFINKIGQRQHATTVAPTKQTTQPPKPTPILTEVVSFLPTYDPSKQTTQPTFAPRAIVGNRQQFDHHVQAGPTTSRYHNAPQAPQTTTPRPHSYSYPTPTFASRTVTTAAPFTRSQKTGLSQTADTFASGSSFPAGVGGPSFGPCRDFDTRCKSWAKYCGIDEYVDDMCRKSCHRCFA